VKELLSQIGIPFVLKDVETSLDAYRELLARGFKTVPVTLVGADPSPTAIVGYDEAALRKALEIS
jgi:hypothetical protein